MVEHSYVLTNYGPGLPLDQRERLFFAKVKADSYFVVKDQNPVHEVLDQIPKKPFVLQIPVPELVQVFSEFVYRECFQRFRLNGNGLFDVLLGVGQLVHSLDDHIVEGSGLHGLHDVVQACSDLHKLSLKGADLRFLPDLPDDVIIAAQQPIHKPLILQQRLDTESHREFQIILRDVLLVAGVVIMFRVAGVVVVLCLGLAGAGDPGHR